MKRFIDNELLQWKSDLGRKPLLIRGARQVGKTYSVRHFARTFTHYLEVNFEADRAIHAFFEKDFNPDEICMNLSAYYNVPVTDGQTLLFLDEIQASSRAISALRFFYEKRPGLHVIAAGSLLEFALQELPSFGVGRISNLFMFPLSFDEFLLALDEERLLELKANHPMDEPLLAAIHTKLLGYLRTFMVIGGLPEVVYSYTRDHNYLQTQRVLDTLISGYEDDFAKYRKRVPVSRLQEVFRYVVMQAGKKFVASKASETSDYARIIEALELLEMAGLVYRVQHTAANGIPLGAEVNPKKFKVMVFDQGIFQRILGLDLPGYLVENDVTTVNKGSLAEQFVGTELMKYQPFHSRPQLFYWQREARGSSAEVDFVMQKSHEIVPIEVKSGTQGKMQSLRLFLHEKKISYGTRVSMENFAQYEQIRVVPLYAVSSLFHTHPYLEKTGP